MVNIPDKTLDTFWYLSEHDILAKYQVDREGGLTDEEARKRLRTYGYSTLKVQKHKGAIKLLLAQFNSPLIYLLFFCAMLSLVMFDNTDALIILGIIVISGFLTFFQERSAFQAMKKLLKIVQVKVLVIRNNKKNEIPLEEVVPGDIVELNAGDVIPGDCYLLESNDLFVDEATLTGETFYAEKYRGCSGTFD